MNLRVSLFCMMLSIPIASASTYGYPRDKRPSLCLSDAIGIAETLMTKRGDKGFYAVEVVLGGSEDQKGAGQLGAGVWTFTYCNAKGNEIIIQVFFPEDRCGYSQRKEDGTSDDMVYKRDGEISKRWLEQKTMMEKEQRESNTFFDSIARPDQQKSTEAEPAGADQPATQPADKAPAEVQPSTPTSKDHPR